MNQEQLIQASKQSNPPNKNCEKHERLLQDFTHMDTAHASQWDLVTFTSDSMGDETKHHISTVDRFTGDFFSKHRNNLCRLSTLLQEFPALIRLIVQGTCTFFPSNAVMFA